MESWLYLPRHLLGCSQLQGVQFDFPSLLQWNYRNIKLLKKYITWATIMKFVNINTCLKSNLRLSWKIFFCKHNRTERNHAKNWPRPHEKWFWPSKFFRTCNGIMQPHKIWSKLAHVSYIIYRWTSFLH